MTVYENTISGVLRNPQNYYFDRPNDAYVARNDDAAWFPGHDVRVLAQKMGLELLADDVGKLLVKPLENHVRMGILT